MLEALLGTEPNRDIARLIRGTANTADELSRNENQLKDLITNLNLTTATFASESTNLRASIRELAPTLRNANEAFASLNAAFPPTRAFATEIRPGVRETPATIDAAFPWIEQTRALVGKDELGGLAEELSPATADLARLIDRATELLPQTDLASKCLRDVVLPDRRPRHQRRVLHRRRELQGVLLRARRASPARARTPTATACTCASRPAAARSRSRSAAPAPAPAQLFGNNIGVPLGNRPAYPGKRPPYKPNEPCYQQKIADVNGPASAKSLPTGTASTAQVKSVRDKLRREADLAAVRAKLNPFGTPSASRRRRRPSENGDPQAPAGLPGHHRPGRSWPRSSAA